MNFEKLVKAFAGFSEGQIRMRLKEFAQFLKKGDNTGWWKLKDGIELLDEENIRKLVTPEMVCLYESMQAGEQRLRGAGYGNMSFAEEKEDEDAEANADIEVQLAPWTTTKNFVLAIQVKGMLQLFGPGDPTGCGEAFSMIRQSMKEMFFRSTDTPEEKQAILDASKAKTYHKFSIADQQQVYKEEINRIWNAQKISLTTVDIPDDGDFEGELGEIEIKKQQMEIDEEKERKSYYGSNSVFNSPQPLPNIDSDDAKYSDREPSISASHSSYPNLNKKTNLDN